MKKHTTTKGKKNIALLDYFAAEAMKAIMSNIIFYKLAQDIAKETDSMTSEVVSQMAYSQAKAMMEASN